MLRSLREKVDSATAEQGEPRILMALTDLPVADLGDLYGDQIGKNASLSCAVFRIHVFFSLPDMDPLVRGMDPDPDPSIIMQKKNLESFYFVIFFFVLSLANNVNYLQKLTANKQKKLC